MINVLDFGAKGDGITDNTAAIQSAIDHTAKQGGGTVAVPAGDFLIGGIRLRSSITLHLLKNAHLIASRDPSDYLSFPGDEVEPIPEADKTEALWESVKTRKSYDFMNKPASRWNYAIIKALDAHDIAIIGEEGSYIDGRDCFDALGEGHYRGPHAINMHRCSNIRFCGYEIRNSANWAHALFDCQNIRAESIRVIAGHDGMHFTTCDNIRIHNSDFQTGDDCVAGIDNVNVHVTECRMNTACSAFRFGGTDVLIENCAFTGPANYLFRGSLSLQEKMDGTAAETGDQKHRYNMLSAFLYYADFSRPIRRTPGNIRLINCSFKNVDRFLEYNFSGSNPWQTNKPLSSISFKNIKAEGIKMPLVLYGDSALKANLEISDTTVSFSEDFTDSFIRLCNFEKVTLQNVTIENMKGPVLIKKWSDDGEIAIRDLNCIGFDGEIEAMTEEAFECQWI